ncbi:hypothetical protein ASL20_09670 [Cupriavidus necator]|uniref:phage tail assembly chaperone n=1 Tax=Cupriavidus necator TaxID=106590 RepID=UPI00073548F6|nr:hypothetical protein [Cupriavidus necator]KUE88884.1 hypothetical protein ASL20_09670 [Cupriavidus necator]
MTERLHTKIGDTDFYIRKFDPFAGLRLLGDLQKDILPAVAHLVQAALGPEAPGMPGGGVDRDALNRAADAGLVEALRELSGKLGGASLEAWANRLLDPECITATINGRDVKLAADVRLMAFRDAGDILELMAQVIRYNFADFLLRWVGRIGPAQKLLGTLSAGSGPTSSPN